MMHIIIIIKYYKNLHLFRPHTKNINLGYTNMVENLDGIYKRRVRKSNRNNGNLNNFDLLCYLQLDSSRNWNSI